MGSEGENGAVEVVSEKKNNNKTQKYPFKIFYIDIFV